MSDHSLSAIPSEYYRDILLESTSQANVIVDKIAFAASSPPQSFSDFKQYGRGGHWREHKHNREKAKAVRNKFQKRRVRNPHKRLVKCLIPKSTSANTQSLVKKHAVCFMSTSDKTPNANKNRHAPKANTQGMFEMFAVHTNTNSSIYINMFRYNSCIES